MWTRITPDTDIFHAMSSWRNNISEKVQYFHKTMDMKNLTEIFKMQQLKMTKIFQQSFLNTKRTTQEYVLCDQWCRYL